MLPSKKAVRHFEFDLAAPFFQQVHALFESLSTAPLTFDSISQLKPLMGLYGLIWRDELVYVGKADAAIADRLERHRRKLEGRRNIDIAEMSFCGVYLAKTWGAIVPEKRLIDHYKDNDLCKWNQMGFGSNDPGRKRDKTRVADEGFDARFPIREDWPTGIAAGRHEANSLLQEIKQALPYLFRYEADRNWRSGSSKYNGKIIQVLDDDMPAADLIRLCRDHLGSTWQATAFPSHIILYEENECYEHGRSL